MQIIRITILTSVSFSKRYKINDPKKPVAPVNNTLACRN